MQNWESNHKEERQAYFKKYVEDNREQINKRNREKVICKCGCVVSRSTLRTHIKRPKHIKQMEIMKKVGFEFTDK